MPTYSYKCKECGNHFDEKHTISERYQPTEKPCNECGGEVAMTMATSSIVAGVAIRDKKPDFFRDRLKDMKKTAGRNNTLNDIM